MKTVYIEGRRWKDEDQMFHTELTWVGSKYRTATVAQDLFNLLRNARKDWKVKVVEKPTHGNYYVVVRGDVWFGIYAPLFKFFYGLRGNYNYVKGYTIIIVFHRKLHIGYTPEGVVVRWRDLFKRKPRYR